jgi:hypothetical protein
MRTRVIFILIALLALLGYAFWRSPYHQVRSLFTIVTIDAPANQVWDVLTDLNGYKSWNPFLTSATGAVAPDSKITVAAKMGKHTITFHPRIVAVDARKKLAWRGTLLTPVIFEGEHTFELEALDQSHTRVIQSEQFRGVLVGFLWRKFSPDLTQGFNAMNHALKGRCEQNHF